MTHPVDPHQPPYAAPTQAQQAYAPPPEYGAPPVRRSADATSLMAVVLNVPLFLGSLLVIWLVSEFTPSHKEGVAARLMSTRPPFHQRIRAIQTFVA